MGSFRIRALIDLIKTGTIRDWNEGPIRTVLTLLKVSGPEVAGVKGCDRPANCPPSTSTIYTERLALIRFALVNSQSLRAGNTIAVTSGSWGTVDATPPHTVPPRLLSA